MATDRDEGFSGPLNSEPPPRPPRRPSRNLLIGGIAAAVAAGLAFGLLARPDLGHDTAAREPMKPAERAVADRFEIEVNAPRMDPVPKATGKLEVLSPDLARAAAEREPPPPAQPEVVAPPPPRYASLEGPPPRPSFDCRYVRSRAEEMVCGDPELAAADRHLARAYSRAVAAGVPQRELRAEQADWLAIRDDAARHSYGAVASVYEQRIGELEALAEDGY